MNSSIKVIDNFVSSLYQDYIEEMFAGNEYKWGYLGGITYGAPDGQPFDGEDDNSGFTSSIFNSQDHVRQRETDFLLPLLYEGISKYDKGAKLKELYRIRAAMWIKNQNKDLIILIVICTLSIILWYTLLMILMLLLDFIKIIEYLKRFNLRKEEHLFFQEILNMHPLVPLKLVVGWYLILIF